MSKSKNMADQFILDFDSQADPKEMMLKPLRVCYEHIHFLIKTRGCKTNLDHMRIVEEANNMWKSFAEKVNKHYEQSVVKIDGFMNYLAFANPQAHQNYGLVQAFMAMARKDHSNAGVKHG